MRKAEMLVEEGDLKERIRKMQKGNEKVVEAIEKLEKSRVKLLKDEE